MNERKVVVLLSGGMDSTVLLHYHLKRGDEVRALAFNYGQRHRKEINFAREMALSLDVPFEVAEMAQIGNLLPGSSQTDESVPVPEGKYDEVSMKATVVPNRNMIMLSVAIGHAIAYKFDDVSYAAHGGDHAIYPDCRPEFADAIGVIAGLCDWRHISMKRPFINIAKYDIASKGHKFGVDFTKTWSCYQGDELHCGKCGTCIERREAFHLADLSDPTSYGPSPTVEELRKNDWHLPGA